MGSPKCRNIGESQPVIIMINPSQYLPPHPCEGPRHQRPHLLDTCALTVLYVYVRA
jgi:hypothetical protein